MVPLSNDSFKEFANCKGMDTNLFFFDELTTLEDQLLVDRTCANCIVKQQCLEWAIAEGLEQGVFGRRYLKNKQKRKKINA